MLNLEKNQSEQGKRLQKEKDWLMVKTAEYFPPKTALFLTTEFLCDIKWEQIKSTRLFISGLYISVSHLKGVLNKAFSITCQSA